MLFQKRLWYCNNFAGYLVKIFNHGLHLINSENNVCRSFHRYEVKFIIFFLIDFVLYNAEK